MLYNTGGGKDKNFILAEDGYSSETLAKSESVMCQGNGYVCIRAVNEKEPSPVGPYTLVAGTFNHLEGGACTELPNAPILKYSQFVLRHLELNPNFALK